MLADPIHRKATSADFDLSGPIELVALSALLLPGLDVEAVERAV